MVNDIKTPKKKQNKKRTNKTGEFASIEAYISQLEPQIILTLEGLGVHSQEDLITYLGCVDSYLEACRKYRKKFYKDSIKLFEKIKRPEDFWNALESLLENMGVPFLYDSYIISDNPAIKKDARLQEMEYCLMIIDMDKIDALRHEVSPCVFNYLMKACLAVSFRNSESMLGQNIDVRIEYHLQLMDEGELDDEDQAWTEDYMTASSKLNRLTVNHKKYVTAKKPKKNFNDFEQSLVNCAQSILDFHPSYAECFVDPASFRFMDYENDHPDEIITNLMNTNYALGYDYGRASLKECYVEDVQQFERDGMFHFFFSEQAYYYPDKVVVDPYRNEKLNSLYEYFNAFDKLQDLIKQKTDD